VPVLGYRTDAFPAFTVRSSGLPVTARVESVTEAAAVVWAERALGRLGGVVLAVPIPADAALTESDVDDATRDALAGAKAEGLSGPAITPYVLARLAATTDGRTIAPNLTLAEHNAAVAGALAVELAARGVS
jgi:pseudouridine-5'-phosphate glycosidase